ncbi:hypothetical protein B0O99DRAFT_592593 [Bisporella sp. PMI_857]|nr:hypothetical protein B0O99DRAFT_592593 [Bisporella sp. PMI_857]
MGNAESRITEKSTVGSTSVAAPTGSALAGQKPLPAFGVTSQLQPKPISAVGAPTDPIYQQAPVPAPAPASIPDWDAAVPNDGAIQLPQSEEVPMWSLPAATPSSSYQDSDFAAFAAQEAPNYVPPLPGIPQPGSTICYPGYPPITVSSTYVPPDPSRPRPTPGPGPWTLEELINWVPYELVQPRLPSWRVPPLFPAPPPPPLPSAQDSFRHFLIHLADSEDEGLKADILECLLQRGYLSQEDALRVYYGSDTPPFF